MLDPITSVLSTRAGALRYPKQAAAALSAASDVNSVITGDILGTVAGVLRFPNEAADALATPPLPPNLLTNPEFAGVVAGSPGTAPTGWTYSPVGTPDVTVDGGELTFVTVAERLTVYQAYAMIVGTYAWEVQIDGGGLQIQDLMLMSDWDSFAFFIDDVAAVGTNTVTGLHSVKIHIGITTPRSISVYCGNGVSGATTATVIITNPTLRKIV